MMENNTTIPAVVANCRLSPTMMMYEHEPLWIIAMLVVSAISTLTAMILRKRRNTKNTKLLRARPFSPLTSLTIGGRGREEGEMV